MSWFDRFRVKKNETSSAIPERREPALGFPSISPSHEIEDVAREARAQKETDNKEADLVLARLRGELPAGNQEHIDIPLEREKDTALVGERKNQEQLVQYIVILKELEEAVGNNVPDEVKMSQPLLDDAFKRAAAAIKDLNRHPQADELGIFSGLVVLVRQGKLHQLIASYEKKRQESVRKIKELQGDRTIQVTQDAWKKTGTQEK